MRIGRWLEQRARGGGVERPARRDAETGMMVGCPTLLAPDCA